MRSACAAIVQPVVALGSDRTREFGEGCREPMLRVNIDTKFIVAPAQVLNEGVPGTDHVGRTKLFQAAHWP